MTQNQTDPSQYASLPERSPFRPVVPDLKAIFGAPVLLYKFHRYPENEYPDSSLPEGITNLEYVIARVDDDLSAGLPLSALAVPEVRAFALIQNFVEKLYHAEDESAEIPRFQIFQKHILQSRLGTHCIFGLRRQGVEIEDHCFVVHVDQNRHVVMLCCTYLPDLPALFGGPSEFPAEPVGEIQKKWSFESAKVEKLWSVIWQGEGENKGSRIVPGNQVKLSLPARKPGGDATAKTRANVVTVTDQGIQKEYRISPGASGTRIGLGKIVRDISIKPDGPKGSEALGDTAIMSMKHQAVLRNLESGAELVGRYAAVQDEINVVIQNRQGVFTNELGSNFDRVNAYYHLDYIQRYFRENLDFQILNEYPQLNPVRVILKGKANPLIAEYDVIKERIFFYKIGKTSTTAARDPRFVYHEFLHTVTDAITRLPRGGAAPATARSQETLQAQAMDEGLADYFACSLAQQQGAQRAAFYFFKNRSWTLDRDLNPQHPELHTITEFKDVDASLWRTAKYKLGEQWARGLWRLHEELGAEVADMIIAYSIFFLTRWATFRHGVQAIRLADRLLFSAEHKEEIADFEKQISLILDEQPVREMFSAA